MRQLTLKLALAACAAMLVTGCGRHAAPQSDAIVEAERVALARREVDAAAVELRFEYAARLRDEIRRLEATELGLPEGERKAPIVGRSNEGKPGTRKTRFGKKQQKWAK